MLIFIIITLATLLFCAAIGFDVNPFLRGPSPYPPEWQWAYLFVNTLSRIYLPIIFILFMVALFFIQETRNTFAKREKTLIVIVIILSFFLQLGLSYFSRAGIAVLIRRIIDPTLNGYFSASLTIQNVSDFLRNYNQEMLQFVYHAKAHPPGAILLFYFIKQILLPFTSLFDFVKDLNPTHIDVRDTWNTLLPIDKITVIFSSFFIPFISTLSLIPLYYSAKLLYGIKTAKRSIFLFFLVPTIVFFIPINDAFLHIFSITAFYFLLKGIKENNLSSFIISGLILFVGVLFNLSLLPVLILFFVFAVLILRSKKNTKLNIYIKNGLFFSIGFFLPMILMYIVFQFNLIQVTQTIMKYVPDVHTRSYTLWLYYNIYDFLVFCGIPISIVFLNQFNQVFINLLKGVFSRIDFVFLAFIIMIVILDFSGSVRGETGRLWSPYIPFMVLIVTNFVTNYLKFTAKIFVGFLLLQALQILVMQGFWVMLW